MNIDFFSAAASTILPDKGPGYGQHSANKPRGMSNDQRPQVLPQSAIITQKVLSQSD